MTYQLSASIIALFIWCMEAFLDGRKEAHFNLHLKNSTKDNANIYSGVINHVLSEKRMYYFTPRLLMTYLLVVILKFTVLWKYSLHIYKIDDTFIIMCTILLIPILMYPLLHDAAFYCSMNRRDPGHYPKGWKTNVDESRYSVNFPLRLYIFIAAIVLLTVQTYIHTRLQ